MTSIGFRGIPTILNQQPSAGNRSVFNGLDPLAELIYLGQRLGIEDTIGILFIDDSHHDHVVEPLERVAPAFMHEQVRGAFTEACDRLGLGHAPLASGAGHDAQCLARICPAGMIFVPSVGGFSHSPREFTEWEDCVNGANVLLQAALILAQ